VVAEMAVMTMGCEQPMTAKTLFSNPEKSK